METREPLELDGQLPREIYELDGLWETYLKNKAEVIVAEACNLSIWSQVRQEDCHGQPELPGKFQESLSYRWESISKKLKPKLESH